MNRIKNVLEDMGIKYDIRENYALIEFWTDTAGQDIPVEIDHNGTAEDVVKQFADYAEGYDVDEQVELFIGGRGQNGVPETVQELLDDCQEAKDTLMEIAGRLTEAMKIEILRTEEEVKDIFEAMRSDMYVMEEYEDNEQALLQELMSCDDEIFELYKKDCLD